MAETSNDLAYVLIIKDDSSFFVWVEPYKPPDAASAVDLLLRWFASFGVARTWVSDRGSRFKKEVMAGLMKALHAHHHFTTPASPQSNGTVETVCKEVLGATKSLTSAELMDTKDWPKVLRVVQSILNHSTRPTLCNRAPIEIFTGQPAEILYALSFELIFRRSSL